VKERLEEQRRRPDIIMSRCGVDMGRHLQPGAGGPTLVGGVELFRKINVMNANCIYHTTETRSGGPSPFDEAIMDMVDGHEVRIACPYLGLEYLKRIIDRAESWRLVTDIMEWLSVHSRKQRNKIVEFIVENRDQIRYCKDLHAKVLIAGNRFFLGEANTTEKGMTGRVEMSVLFEECEQVDELRAWFDLLWCQTASVLKADLRVCAATLPSHDLQWILRRCRAPSRELPPN